MSSDTESAVLPAPTARPSGRVYRRRKPLTAQGVMWNDDGIAVMVYGTHDRALADDLAAKEWARESLDGSLPEPVAEWVKEVPWDALRYGYDRTILSVHGDTKGSTPVLRYGGDQ